MSYVDDTEYATRSLIELAMKEEASLKEKLISLSMAEKKLKMNQWDYQTSDLSDDFSDMYVIDAFNRMASAKQETDRLKLEIVELQVSIGAKQVAIQSICGALLQIAKQGISLVHGSLTNAPAGRTIGTENLKDIIWQARNQAIHYEDGTFNKSVTNLFQQLMTSHGNNFSLTMHAHQSRAKQIIMLLDWRSYSQYYSDMKLLGL